MKEVPCLFGGSNRNSEESILLADNKLALMQDGMMKPKTGNKKH